MGWLRTLSLNVVALGLAAGVGAIAVSQVVYLHEIQTGAVPLAPFIRGFVVSVIVATIAPTTRFGIRFAVFTGIYILELALSIVAAAAAVELVNFYFGGDREAAEPYSYFGALISLVTGFAAYFTLRRYRAEVPSAST